MRRPESSREDVHAAVVQAIRQTICNPDEEYRKISKEILGETGGDCLDQIEAIDQKLTEEQALYTRNEERITALRKELEASEDGTLAYDDKLVPDFIKKIEVFPDAMRFTMKAGTVTEVKV